MFRWEFATALAGAILNINPFDQPNVQESKDFTKNILELHKDEGKLPPTDYVSVHDEALPEALSELLNTVGEGDYVAINAFVDPTNESFNTFQAVRATLRERLKTATTVGFGPRYLHSTGQIHKGGPPKGVFIQVTMDDQVDIDVPGESYSFGVLKAAQAIGDYQALKSRRRRIMRVHLNGREDLPKLIQVVKSL
jgi:hypothetical protein